MNTARHLSCGGRLKKQAWTIAGLSGTKVEETGYWPSGEVKWKIWPDGDASGNDTYPWAYDRNGRLTAFGGNIWWIHYNPSGQVTEIRYGNDTATQNSYDPARNWLVSTRTKKVSTNTTPLRGELYAGRSRPDSDQDGDADERELELQLRHAGPVAELDQQRGLIVEPQLHLRYGRLDPDPVRGRLLC